MHKTLALITRSFWWPQIRWFVEVYVCICGTCWMKIPRHHPYGLLYPLPSPNQPWQLISVNFIPDLSVSNGFDTILKVLDHFTKLTHFLPCTKSINGEVTIDFLMWEVFQHHDLLSNIIYNDQGLQFVSKFWWHLLWLLKVSYNLSSSYHPQTDGQTEHIN
jgi:hypothetical protein